MARSSASKKVSHAVETAAPPPITSSSATAPTGAGRGELSLRDLHHWVRNTLQLVLSLLNIQLGATSSAEARTALEESIHRIRALSKAQDLFYPDLPGAQINLAERLEKLFALDFSHSSHNLYRLAPIQIHTIGAPVLMTFEQALPCCLAVSELLSGFANINTLQKLEPIFEVTVHSQEMNFYISIIGTPLTRHAPLISENMLEFRLAKCFAAQGGAELSLTAAGTELCMIRGQIRSFLQGREQTDEGRD